MKIEKAIILAAGLGSRLGLLTANTPKCLLAVKGKPILINALDNLANCGFKEVIIVVGYLKDKIKEAVGDDYKGVKISYVENQIYDKTNNMYSLWLVKDHLKEGVFLIEGDTFFEEELLKKVMAASPSHHSFWAADHFQLFKDGCLLTSGEDGVIKKIEIVRNSGEKDYLPNHHKSADLLKITPELGEKFADWLDKEVLAGNVNLYYDLVLAKYLPPNQLFICDIHGLKWMEIDDYSDLRRAEAIFSDSAGSFERKYEVVPIERLRPLERVFPTHLKNLNELILKDGLVKSPLLADRDTGIVLDGSHRYIFFLMHGYKTVPVHFVDYLDENIRVGTHLMHRHLIVGKTDISKSEVIGRGLSGKIFPPRTTRHFFPFRKIDDLNLPLSKLEKGEPRPVDQYIEKVSAKDEIEHNEGFIKEIEQEIDEVINYLYESRKVKEYLKFQVDEMKKKF